jgi:curved DNA-binding protein CbpA
MSTLRAYRYYSILGVKRTASLAEIKRAYRMLAKSYHPDRNPSKEASDYFIKITRAYEVLSNAETRSQYDNSTAECLRCWTHEVIQSNDRILCRRCHSEYKLWEIERLHKAFLSSQCSHCKYFYTNPFDCQASQIENPCGYFEESTDNDRRQFLAEEIWFGKAYDYMYNCSGNVSRCRYCGAISLNPKTTTCWSCKQKGLECPNCNKILLYKTDKSTWRCPNCGKEYGYRSKASQESKQQVLETCPFCKRTTLKFDKNLLLWRCANCRRILTKDELTRYQKQKQYQDNAKQSTQGEATHKNRRVSRRKIAAIAIPVAIFCIILGFTNMQNSSPATSSNPTEAVDAVPAPWTDSPNPGDHETQPEVEYEENTENPFLPPDDSFVTLNDYSEWGSDGSLKLNGFVGNTHSTWKMTDIELEVVLYDIDRNYVDTVTKQVASELLPNSSTTYNYTIYPVSWCYSCDIGITYYWEYAN